MMAQLAPYAVNHRLTRIQTKNRIILERIVKCLRDNITREFTSTDIEVLNIFPWAKSSRARIKMIEKDFQGENLLKTKIVGLGTQRRYYIKSQDIINYIEKYGAVLMPTE